MELSNTNDPPMLVGSPCPNCKKERMYKTKQGLEKGRTKICKSCSNSFLGGGTGLTYNENGERLCSRCKTNVVGWNTLCNPCNIKDRQVYWETKMRFDRYGITKEIFESRFTGNCEICNIKITKQECAIDHDHETQKFRGILCKICNSGLGFFKDSITTLENAIKYLKENGNK